MLRILGLMIQTQRSALLKLDQSIVNFCGRYLSVQTLLLLYIFLKNLILIKQAQPRIVHLQCINQRLRRLLTIENDLIPFLEELRQKYNETKDKKYWKELIRWLPESWLQTRTVTLNYENLRNIYFQRQNHKLTEWHVFCHWVELLPYAKELILYN